MNTFIESKSSNYSQVIPLVALGLALAGLAGCASPGYKKGDAAAVSMSAAAAEVQAESVALEMTRSSLSTLVDNPPSDLKLAYRNYSEALDKLVSCAHRTEGTGKTMARKSQEYFAAWDRQLTNISYEVIRNTSSARETEARGQFDTVNRRYRDTQAVVWPLIAYLDDIRNALSTDLTQGGVESAKPVVAHANENMDKVQTAFAGLAAALGDARGRFSTVVKTAQAPN